MQVRKELGYPVMATPFSQIVGVQAMENIVSGKRYETIPDEVIKYALGLYGKLDAPVDEAVMARINKLPRTRELTGWKPKGYDDSIEKIRSEYGPDLDDDDLLLTILIPGYNKDALTAQSVDAGTPARPASATTIVPVEVPTEFSVEVDGELFDVKVLPKWGAVAADRKAADGQERQNSAAPVEHPAGAIVTGMAGLVISIDAGMGDQIQEGDQIAVIEAMKMMRSVSAPHGGIVKEVCVEANQVVDTNDILMIVE
jgi:biotin carboxyl carrier protein